MTLNYFYLWADETNNRGGSRPLQQLASRTFGHELDIAVSWAISRHFFFLGFAGIADPGSAIDKALVGGGEPWSTVQFSLFWNL